MIREIAKRITKDEKLLCLTLLFAFSCESIILNINPNSVSNPLFFIILAIYFMQKFLENNKTLPFILLSLCLLLNTIENPTSFVTPLCFFVVFFLNKNKKYTLIFIPITLLYIAISLIIPNVVNNPFVLNKNMLYAFLSFGTNFFAYPTNFMTIFHNYTFETILVIAITLFFFILGIKELIKNIKKQGHISLKNNFTILLLLLIVVNYLFNISNTYFLSEVYIIPFATVFILLQYYKNYKIYLYFSLSMLVYNGSFLLINHCF
jgi:hypothetical protein